MPTIRLGGEAQPFPGDGRARHDRPPAQPRGRGRRGRRPGRSRLAARARPAVLLHGWLDNADTWLAVLDRLAVAGRPAIAYDLPGFGTAPPLEHGLGARPAGRLRRRRGRAEAAERVGERGRRRRQLARRLGRAAPRRGPGDLPLAGIVPIGPAGIRMAPAFFTLDRMPAVSRIIGMPAPVPPAVVRSVAGSLYRQLAFADPGGRRQGGRRPLHPLPRRPAGDPRADRVREAAARRARRPVRRRGDQGPGDRDLGRGRPALPGRRRRPARRAPAAREDRDAARRRPHAADRGAGGRRRRDRRARRLGSARRARDEARSAPSPARAPSPRTRIASQAASGTTRRRTR